MKELFESLKDWALLNLLGVKRKVRIDEYPTYLDGFMYPSYDHNLNIVDRNNINIPYKYDIVIDDYVQNHLDNDLDFLDRMDQRYETIEY